MKKSLLVLSLLAAVNASALSLDEAIEIALKKNSTIEINKSQFEQSKYQIDISKSAIKPSVDLSYSYTNRLKKLNSQDREYAEGSIAASYNLFNGYKAVESINSAKFLSESANYILEATKNDIILAVKESYINYLNLVKALKTYESSYKSFKKQYEDANNRFKQGLLARNELLEVEVEMLDSKQNVVKAKADLEIAKYELGNILGGEDLSSEKIDDLIHTPLKQSDYSEDRLDDRSEVKALKSKISSAYSNIKVAKSAYYPTVDLALSVDKTGDSAIMDEDFTSSARVALNWNIYNGENTKSQVNLNKELARELKHNLVKTKLDIKLQYQQALAELKVAKENIKTSKLALEQATQNYEIVNNKFLEGLSTSSDLIDANYLLTQARQKYYTAYYSEFIALAKLDRVFEK